MAAAAVERPSAAPEAGQRFQGVQKQSAGYRLLSAMGWKEGEGLGASKQGIKSHIRVKKKYENWGVGAVEAAQHAQSWTNGMLDFHRVLSNLSEVVSEHARRAADFSDDEESDASRGEQQQQQQRAGKAAGKKRAEKKGAGKQQKKRKEAAASSSSDSSDDEAEEAPAPKRVRGATHIGRFKKREAAKMVKGYSQADLAAIVGMDPFAAAAAKVAEVRADRGREEEGGSGYDSDAEPSASDGGAEGQQQQQQGQQQGQQPAAKDPAAPPKPEMIVVRRPMAGAQPAPPPPEAQEGRRPGWWQVCFHRAAGPGAGAGAGAGAGSGPAAINIHGFSEQDQTNLYNLAHDKATQGRVGLGRGSMPKKVAGARWAGKKTKISDSDDEGEEEGEGEEQAVEAALQQGPAPGGVQLAAEEGLVIVLPPSKRHLLEQLEAGQQQGAAAPANTQQQQQQAKGQARGSGSKAKKAKQRAADEAAKQPAADAAASPLAGMKWKKAVGAALKASGKGRLKLSKLHRAVVKEAGLPKALRGQALDALTAFLQQSKRFRLEDGVVRPAA